MLQFKDSRFSWGGDLEGTRTVDEATAEDVLKFDAGFVIRLRITHQEPPHRIYNTYYYDPHGPLGANDLIHSQVLLSAVPGGTQVSVTYVVERRTLFRGLLARLLYPFKVSSLAHVLRHELARRCAAGERGKGPSDASLARTLFERLAPTRMQAVLALATFAWLTLGLGPQTAFVFWVTILVHEYGHVWSMRRHGVGVARFYFIPLFGGVAFGGKMRTEAQSVEVTLMGPVFGLLPGIMLSLWVVAGREGWLGATAETAASVSIFAMLSIFLNGFNLLPVVPLDGGHVMQAILRPFVGRAWIFASGFALLSVFIVLISSLTAGLFVAFGILALFWMVSARGKVETLPLSAAGVLAVATCYIALIAIHVAVIGAMFVTPNGPISVLTFLESFVWAWKMALFGP